MSDPRIVPFPRGKGGQAAGGPAELWAAQAAHILHVCFSVPDGYPTPEQAGAEIADLVASAACLLVAVEDAREGPEVVGLIGSLDQYRGKAWELHPLAVRPDRQGRGLGTALVAALEEEARRAGVGVLYLGTDDTTGRTSASGRDLFPGVLAHAAALRSLREGAAGHPFAFYRRLGFEVVGLIPDANGFGQPDIMMARRV